VWNGKGSGPTQRLARDSPLARGGTPRSADTGGVKLGRISPAHLSIGSGQSSFLDPLIGICENIDFNLFTIPRGWRFSTTSAFLITTAFSAVATISFVPGFRPSLSLTSGGSWMAPSGVL